MADRKDWRTSVPRPPPLTEVAARGMAAGLSDISENDLLSLRSKQHLVQSPSVDASSVGIFDLDNIPSPQYLQGSVAMATPLVSDPPVQLTSAISAGTAKTPGLGNTARSGHASQIVSGTHSFRVSEPAQDPMMLTAQTAHTAHTVHTQVPAESLIAARSQALSTSLARHRSSAASLRSPAQHPSAASHHPLSHHSLYSLQELQRTAHTVHSEPAGTMFNAHLLEESTVLPATPGAPLPPPTSPLVLETPSMGHAVPMQEERSVKKKKKIPKKKKPRTPTPDEELQSAVSQGLYIPIPTMQQQVQRQELYQQQVMAMPSVQPRPLAQNMNFDNPDFRQLMLQAAQAAAQAARDAVPVALPSANTSNPNPYAVRAEDRDIEDDDLPTVFSAAVVGTDISRNLLMEKLKKGRSEFAIESLHDHDAPLAPCALYSNPSEYLAHQEMQMQSAPHYLRTEVRPPLAIPANYTTDRSYTTDLLSRDPVDLAQQLVRELRASIPSPPPSPDVNSIFQTPHAVDNLNFARRLEREIVAMRKPSLWQEMAMEQ
eukprot:TRINITY_DN16296_c0_g1_i1.p1 TRINITY_DN16296_c0_g1~~TRINITY_DN16296_c0_g1_i1.p1  ORF type:complete len:544 (+),score=96.21 TRINITY_DN16296_c0_g1_i1:137-1768(+)